MPEQDFELYLSLLSRFLRLKPGQHAEIADELRDHLEQRLEELAARGLTHEEAIRKALDEFGDAAELANHFTRAAHIRRRRLIMRCTLGIIGTVAAAFLFVTAFWPETSSSPLPRRGVARDRVAESQPGRITIPAYAFDEARATAEDKLSKRLDKLEFKDMPLEKVVEYFSEQTGLDFIIDRRALEEEGVQLDTPISISIKRTKLPARAALELALDPLKLNFDIRHGMVVITTFDKVEERFEIQVYNIRDVLAGRHGDKSAVDAGRRHSLESPVISRDAPTTAEVLAADAGLARKFKSNIAPNPSAISQLIMCSIAPESWDVVGGPCSVFEFDEFPGLVFVRTSRSVHDKIKELLVAMRHALGDPAANDR